MAFALVLNRHRPAPLEESPTFSHVAERFRRAGDLKRAVALCRDGLRRFPNHVSARVTLGLALVDLGEYDQARTELQQALRRAPDNLAAIRGLAHLHDHADADVSMQGGWEPRETTAPVAPAIMEPQPTAAAAVAPAVSEPAPQAEPEPEAEPQAACVDPRPDVDPEPVVESTAAPAPRMDWLVDPEFIAPPPIPRTTGLDAALFSEGAWLAFEAQLEAASLPTPPEIAPIAPAAPVTNAVPEYEEALPLETLALQLDGVGLEIEEGIEPADELGMIDLDDLSRGLEPEIDVTVAPLERFLQQVRTRKPVDAE